MYLPQQIPLHFVVKLLDRTCTLSRKLQPNNGNLLNLHTQIGLHIPYTVQLKSLFVISVLGFEAVASPRAHNGFPRFISGTTDSRGKW